MYNQKQRTILIIAIILLLAVGFLLGVLSQKYNKVQVMKNEAVNSLSSKTVSSITVYGKITNIEDRNITLSNLGDSLTVLMSPNARIYSFVGTSGQATTTQIVLPFENIKVGDSVNIILNLSDIGQMQGDSLIVLPPV